MRWLWTIITLAMTGAILAIPNESAAVEFVVYSVYRPLDLGIPGEVPQKDYYVNIGSSQGVRVGSTLEVMRRSPTYDILTEKLYKDITFPIAHLKVIHVEGNAAVARLEKMLPGESTPSLFPRAVMVGDIVQPAQ